MPKERPLSPHLQVYKPQMTSLLSILNRGTGMFMAVSTPILIYWLWTIADGNESYTSFQTCIGSVIGRLFLFAWTFSLFYHMSNGIRHLFWDMGKGFELETLHKSGKVVIASACLLTILTWVAAYSVGGQ